ncbi:MAG: DUF192 domain-containing protein [Beijerinckiaceae bacterium]|jgi:uncharacterized membrane protein (UPF0127 family)
MAISGSHWRFGALILAAFALSASQPGAGRAEGGLETLEIDTASGPRILQVEVMRTEQERERGLMFRKYLPKERGMLFDFPVEQPVMMWMKNTYIPLDMVFMDHNGRIVGIARNAEPLSETIIPSGAPAAGVLEINGGEAAELGLKTGDVVHHPLFKN